MVARVASRVVRGWGRVLGRFAHPGSRDVVAADPSAGLEDLRDRSYCLLVSRTRDGRQIPTALWFAFRGDRVVFRTDAVSPKVFRLRRDPEAIVAPCNIRGRPLGPAIAVRAQELTDPGQRHEVERAIGDAYGLRGRAWNRLVRISGLEAACFELSPATGRSGAAGP